MRIKAEKEKFGDSESERAAEIIRSKMEDKEEIEIEKKMEGVTC